MAEKQNKDKTKVKTQGRTRSRTESKAPGLVFATSNGMRAFDGKSKENIKEGAIASNLLVQEPDCANCAKPSKLSGENSKFSATRQPVIGKVIGERIILESSDAARDLYASSRYGAIVTGGKVQLSMLEALYLLEKEKIAVVDSRSRKMDMEKLMLSGKKADKTLYTKYCVFRDLRSRGYIVKTALKFGADLRVYDRGVKPGEDHAKWIVYPVHESQHMTWYEFAAKNRVAHSTKKRLLIAIVDDEGDVTYYEIKWERP